MCFYTLVAFRAWALYFTLTESKVFVSIYCKVFKWRKVFRNHWGLIDFYSRFKSFHPVYTIQAKQAKYWGQTGWYTFKVLPLHTSLFSTWGQKIIEGTCPGRRQSASNLIACTDSDWTKKIDIVFRYEKRRQSVSDFICSSPEIRWAMAQPQHIEHFFLNILPKPHRSVLI